MLLKYITLRIYDNECLNHDIEIEIHLKTLKINTYVEFSDTHSICYQSHI